MIDLNIQMFGGRGASSSAGAGGSSITRIDGIRSLSDRAKSIMADWQNTLQATEESEQAMRKELNEYSFDDLLKLAQRVDEFDYARTSQGSAFAVNILSDNIYAVGRRKNSNKWGIEFGKWREENRR